MKAIVIATFYRFVTLEDCVRLQRPFKSLCEQHNIQGTVLLAREGINGTIAGNRADVDAVFSWFDTDPRLADLARKESFANEQPYKRLKIKIKNEIIRLNQPQVDPATMAGERVDPAQWNELLKDPDVVVIDTRNTYEVSIGTFPTAINPRTHHFSQLPRWLEQQTALRKKPRVAMFCTGGIRCEKSTALLVSQGFEDVFHLDGGILKYLETVPPEDNQWQGECFVFDDRISVTKSLEPGSFKLCQRCGDPIPKPAKTCQHCLSEQDINDSELTENAANSDDAGAQ